MRFGKFPLLKRVQEFIQKHINFWGDKIPSRVSIKNEEGTPIDHIKKYVNLLHNYTKRNVIIYYSGWLYMPSDLPVGINDLDMNGFMAMCYGLDFKKGLDLILHTPGGDVAATEAIINYLYKMFNGNIRAIIPQLAMSGGTMIACSCEEIIMGKQSSLGPIDPQFKNLPAQGILNEFETAKKEISENPSTIPLWQLIIKNYTPTLLGSCQNGIDWANEIFQESLSRNMLKGESEQMIKKVVKLFGSQDNTKAHDRHLSIDKCREFGLKVRALEEDDTLQEYVLSIHHSCMELFEQSAPLKIFCNQFSEFLFFSK